MTQTIGRFAPSPTGPLHLGASWPRRFVAVRAVRGREMAGSDGRSGPSARRAGADREILATLARYGLEWDGEVVRQSSRTALYEEALRRLAEGGPYSIVPVRARSFGAPPPHPPNPIRRSGSIPEPAVMGFLRAARRGPCASRSVRIDLVRRSSARPHSGRCGAGTGDFVVKRADGLFAYQLAVVADDASQGVTQVVRGADLLSSTARQIALQRALGIPTRSTPTCRSSSAPTARSSASATARCLSRHSMTLACGRRCRSRCESSSRRRTGGPSGDARRSAAEVQPRGGAAPALAR